jgi:putative intracellular protease/amidase
VPKKVLIINTSAGEHAGQPTGVWLEETAAPYYAFKAAGFDVEMANPAGGASPIDAASMGEGFFTDGAKKFMHDPAAVGMFLHQTKLEKLEPALTDTYDAIYLAGGHGTCTDFVDNKVLKSCIEKMMAAGKVVAADCHGPIALAQCTKPTGEPLVQGLTVTGFSNAEEAAVQQTDKVPFLIETKFTEQGAKYESGSEWSSKCCTDGNLITGQNPQSSEACAAAVVAKLS